MLKCFCRDGDLHTSKFLWSVSRLFTVFDRPRRCRCKSCKKLINQGEQVVKIFRVRAPRNDIEERIYGEEVAISNWFLCEICGGLMWAIEENTTLCVDIEEDLKVQILEHNRSGEEYEDKY